MKSDAVYLQHMRDALDRVQRYASDGKDAFFTDERTQDAKHGRTGRQNVADVHRQQRAEAAYGEHPDGHRNHHEGNGAVREDEFQACGEVG